MTRFSGLLGIGLLAGLCPVQSANSIFVDTTTEGLLEFSPTLVHSDGSDPAGGQIVDSESTAYGVDHGGVAQIVNGSGDMTCTGALLGSGEHVLIAGHCASSGLSAVFDVGGTSVTMPVVETAVHPNYNGVIFHGYGVGVLTLEGPAPAEIPRYDLNRSLNDLGVTGVAVGYGASGHGATGATVSKGQKRAGLIEFEINALPSPIMQNTATQLTADFDSGDPSNDAMALYYGLAPDLGFGADEIAFAPGDSGSPVFQKQAGGWVIAGVASYVARFTPPSSTIPHSDVDAVRNSSFGEFSVAARVAEPNVLSFIDDIAGVSSVTPIPEPTTGLLALIGFSLCCLRRRLY